MSGSSTRARRIGIAVASVLAAAILVAASPYPSPAFDFAHPGTGHDPRLTPAGGTNDRPLLIIVTLFSDEDEPTTTATPAVDAKFFGARSITDYFRASSFGKLTFSRAAETYGDVNDGIVHVPMAPTYATWGATPEATRHRQALLAADPFVDFATFDRDGNGNITDDELAIVEFQEASAASYNCGGTRGIAGTTVLDGKTLHGVKSMSFGASSTNKITYIHELGHQALGEDDHSYVTGPLDLMGGTCGGAEDLFFDHHAWHKLHLGWITPTVVTRDGFYTVSRWDTTGQAFLLYDPDRGTNDYFLVENRRPTTGSYDEDAADAGLVIWRIDDTKFGGVAPNTPYQLMLPGSAMPAGTLYGGSSADAWDPGDFSTPQRTMVRTWSDGTPSKVAVRAIGDTSDVVRVFFDVRGPGVLVDPSTTVTEVTMLTAESITFPVMNTGEASDTFDFTLTSLPSGWTATTHTLTLPACSGITCTPGSATVQLTVPANTPTGDYAIRATGRSTTDSAVTSSTTFPVRVVKRATTMQYTGATTGDYSDPATVSAVLTDTATGLPIAGKTVDLTIGTQSTDPDPGTDAAGTVSGSITVTQPSGGVTATATFAGDGTYVGSSDSVTFTITKETLSFAYTGSTLVQLGTVPTLSALATEEADGSAGDLTRAAALFSLAPSLTATPFTYEAAVTAAGSATTSAAGLPVDLWSVTVSVPASNQYWTGSTATPTELVSFDPAAKFTGDAAGRDSVGDPIAVKFDARYDSRLRPRGVASVKYSGGTFNGKDPAWIVQVGDVAIIEVAGTVGRSPATLRLRADDNAEPGRPDTFRLRIGGYDSGTTSVTSGNLQAHPT